MRDILTGIAVIVILVLTTVLVAPYFVDWNGQRGFLEARLSAALGQKVTIGGHIDLKVLPTPYLVLDQVVVGSDDGAVRIGIHHVDLELSVAPLLHGAFDIVEVRLQEPTIRIGLLPDRTIPVLPAAPAFQADVHFDRIQVTDGTLAIADPTSGRTFTFDHIDLDADAGSFTGPFKVAGAGGLPEQRTLFRLSTSAPENGRAHTRLIVEENADHPAVELDGTLDLASKDAASPQKFDGRLVLSGHMSGLADEPPPWALSGAIKADTRAAEVVAGELRLGNVDAGLTLQADLKASFDDRPQMALALSAKQIDIDRLSGAPVDSVKPPPPRLPDLATLRQAFIAMNPPLATTVDASIDNATYGGEALSGIKARFGLGASAAEPLVFSASGPAGTRLAIEGTFSPKAYTPFDGSVDIEAANLDRAVDWLGRIAPGLPWHGGDVPFASLHVAGRLIAGNDRIDSDKLTVTLDRSVLSGPAHFVLGQVAVPSRLSTDLSADDLVLDSLPAFDPTHATLAGLDLDLKLRANSVSVATFGHGSLTTGALSLSINRSGQRIDVNGLRLQNIGGADLSATGRLDASEMAMAFDLDADRLETASALAQQLFPGALADAVAARASTLSPAKLKLTTSVQSTSSGGAAPLSFELTGTVGATRVEAAMKPGGGDDNALSLSASFKAADGGILLRQLVAGDTGVRGMGPGELRFSAASAGSSPLDTDLTAMLGATQIGVKGRLKALALPLSGTGTGTIRSRAIGPLMEAMNLKSSEAARMPVDLAANLSLEDGTTRLSDLNGQIGDVPTTGTLAYKKTDGEEPALTGSLAVGRLSLPNVVAALILGSTQKTPTGAWSQEPFSGGLAAPPKTAITVEAATLDLGHAIVAQKARFDLTLDRSALQIDHLSAQLANGTLSGRTLIRRDGEQATVEGQLALGGQTLDQSAFSSQLDATLDFAGSGPSPAGIVANLAGSGTAIASRLTVRHADPAALAHVLKDVEGDVLAVDQDTIARAFDESARAPLDIGTQKFDLGLASGLLRFTQSDPPSANDASYATRVEGNYDIGQARFDGRLEETLLALPKNWSGPPPTIVIAFSGSPGRLTRTVDVGNFLNAVAARALTRETARIDAYELDIRERSFFNARLQVEKRHEEDRKADADRKAKLETVRLERARQEATRAARANAEAATSEKSARDGPPQAPPRPKNATPPAPATGDPSALGRY